MDMIELVQEIGNEVCDGCGNDVDCGINPKDCPRVDRAAELLREFIGEDV